MGRIYFILFYTLCLLISTIESTLVATTTGPIRGKPNNVDGVQYTSFEGIPYGRSPFGDLRFRAPIAVDPWTQVLNATAATPVCLQEELLYTYDQMSEDCLYLNVYTPEVAPIVPRAVLVFLHGGYFIWGSGNRLPMFGPEKIISNDAVAVTLNYRLGAFGFLSIDSKEAPGNAGLKDVLLALKWISANIRQFGGDPAKITLAGVEAGAMLVNYLMLTKKSEGLFQKAMLLTGSALSYRALNRHPKNVVTNLATKLGITYNDKTDLLHKLTNINAFELLKAQTSIVYDAPDLAFALNYQFAPCIEPDSSSAVITSDPLDDMKAGNFMNIPVFMGFNSEDGLEVFPYIKDESKAEKRIKYLNDNFDACIPRDINYPVGSQMRKDLANSIKQFYFDNGKISMFNVQNYVNLITDTAYGYSADVCLQLFKQKANSQIYFYLLELNTDIYWFKVFHNITYPGASHFDSLFFVQPITLPRQENVDSRKLAMLNEIKNYMYNFINYGNPTPEGSTNTTVQWSDSGENRAYLSLGDSPVLVPHPPFQDRLNFWHGVYHQYHQYMKNVESKVSPIYEECRI